MRNFVVSISLVVLLCGQAKSGELDAADIISARKALVGLIHNEADQYQFEAKRSGCSFDACSTELVSFARYASFSVVSSAVEAPILRKKIISCTASTSSHDWRCWPDGYAIGKLVGSRETTFLLSPEIGDDLVIELLSYMRSECFAQQLNQYDNAGTKVPKWAREDFTISGIVLNKGQYYISVPFEHPVIGDGVYIVEPSKEQALCGFSLARFWLRHI